MPALRPVPLTVFTAGAALLAVAAAPTLAVATPASSRMVQHVNAVRASHGLPKLRESRTLRRESYRHSRSMLMHGYFAHGSLRGPARAEIIERHSGEAPRVRLALRLWMRSPGHRRVILTRSYRVAGAGVSTSRGSTAWTLRFR